MELHIVFHVGDAAYALPASAVLQMETFTGATRVPGTPEYVVGLVQIRGSVVPVLDLRLRFGLPKAPLTLDSRIVVVERDARRVGLLVDSAREIMKIDPQAFQPPPELVTAQSAHFVSSVARAGDRLLMLIDCDRVIGEENIHGEHPNQHN
jgi:purine-binding chemotaxis protein CheW